MPINVLIQDQNSTTSHLPWGLLFPLDQQLGSWELIILSFIWFKASCYSLPKVILVNKKEKSVFLLVALFWNNLNKHVFFINVSK